MHYSKRNEDTDSALEPETGHTLKKIDEIRTSYRYPDRNKWDFREGRKSLAVDWESLKDVE